VKKLLVIANLFHASPRIPGVATYLPEFGWSAIIITPPLGSNAETRFGFPKKFLKRTKIVVAPYRGDIFWFWRKIFRLFGFKTTESITEQIKERAGITSKRSFVDALIKWYQTIFAYPDTEKSWKGPALRAASEIVREEHFDAILSSSPFATSHIVAAELKRKYGVCWLADFRDPWTRNHNYPYGVLRRYFEEKLELKVLKKADIMTAATPAYAKKQEELHQRAAAVITNGFDNENLNCPPVPLTQKLTITYSGTIYIGKQDPEKVFIALNNLISKKIVGREDVEIRFYGPRQNWLNNNIAKYGLDSIVHQYGVVSRYEVMQKQRESHILLLIDWEDPVEKGVYPGKIFEYLCNRRPILVTGGYPGDDVEKLLIETKAGIHASTVEEIETALSSFYEEYKRSGCISYQGNLEEINRYSYREMAKKIADILNQITI
jgi:hypothetical protein